MQRANGVGLLNYLSPCSKHLAPSSPNMARFRFEDLQIWREACRIGDELDDLADALDAKRKRRYAEQLRAAALSVSNNIAEGSGSSSDKDFRNFLNIAHVRWWRALSNKEAEQIRAAAGRHAVIHVIPNGVDLDEVDAIDTARVTSDEWRVTSETFKETRRPQDQETPAWMKRRRPKRLLFLSRIHAKKGLDLLVPAWGKLTKEFPDWELLIVGPDEGGYQATVEKMIAESGCGETCWINPAVSGAEKHALLRTADLFVLPSYSEGFPMAVLEAAAHRIPVVQTNECNFPELAAAGGAWECRPKRDAVERVLRESLTAEDVERAERGSRGRELVERRYSWDQIAEQVLVTCRA